LIGSLPSRSLTTIRALIFAMATVAVLLTLTPQTLAQARKAACSSSTTSHAKRSAHACAQSKRTSKSSHKSKTHSHPKGNGHHVKHGVKPASPTKSAIGAKAPAATSLTPATCEDSSAPVRAGDGSFSCDDESEPGCESGSAPTLSSDRSTLICNVATGSAGSPRNF
jgi:hypothetical protein